jgi:hypothetical protein
MVTNWLEEDAKWYRHQNETAKHMRGESDWQCGCWIVCTAKCEEEKKEWLEKKSLQN